MPQLNSTKQGLRIHWRWSGDRLHAVALAGLTGLGVYLCYRLAQPCIPALVWAGALAVVFTPLQQRIESRIQNPNLATALSLLIVGLLVVAPATWFAQKLAEQATSVPDNIQRQIAAGKWHVGGNEHPLGARLLSFLEHQVRLPANAAVNSNWANALLSRLLRESAVAAVQLCLTLYFLFHFLRDRARVLKAIRSLVPMGERDIDALFGRVSDTVHATMYGMLALSLLQGLLGGTMFWWLGIPSPWFWALVTAVFAFVPVLDAIVLWAPAAVYLGLEGRWGEALGVATVGSLLVRAIENFLYPVLVKDQLKVPSVSIFIAVVGGMLLFGWSGLVLGPVIVALTSVLLELCANRMAAREVDVRSQEFPKPEQLTSATLIASIRATSATRVMSPYPTVIRVIKLK